MARNRDKRSERPIGFQGERTMAAAEQDALEQGKAPADDARCVCGSQRFVLEAYLEVEGGMPNPEPIEVEALTCPECGREYEPILTGNGRVLRGEFRGFFDEKEP
jgi:hypothetical protein